MTITEQVKDFLYTHPVQHKMYQDMLVNLIEKAEAEYVKEIEDLRKQIEASAADARLERIGNDYAY